VADAPLGAPSRAQLRRAITLWPLLLYGLGEIVGAGIYVAVGTVIERAGSAAPLSFLIAGIAATLTGLCYAELGSRLPAAGGIAGLIAAIAFGWLGAAAWPDARAMLPRDLGAWGGVLSGASIAFFAFIGFENLSNLAEEVKNPRRTLPLGILGSLAASLVLYV